MAPALGLLLLLGLLACARDATACVAQWGEPPDPAHTGTGWSYAMNGDDWVGVDGSNVAWVCSTGLKQSPINLPAVGAVTGPRVPSTLQTFWNYDPLTSDGSNIQVINNGHTIQIQWTGALTSQVTVATKSNLVTDLLTMDDNAGRHATRITAIPKQFHFHSTSEHLANGEKSVLELHIVHNIPQTSLPNCPTGGCFMVTGMMIVLREGPDNPYLGMFIDAAPGLPGTLNNLTAGLVLNINNLLPSSRDYLTYEGSLTTPPCSEGLLWHVFTNPIYMSPAQFLKYRVAVGHKLCDVYDPSGNHITSDPAGHRKLMADPNAYDPFTAHVHTGNHLELASQPGRSLLTTYTYSGCNVTEYVSNYRVQQPLNARIVRASISTTPTCGLH